MTLSRGLILAIAVTALLAAGAAADAKTAKKKRVAMPVTTASVPAATTGPGMGMMGMGGTAGAGMGMQSLPPPGEPFVLRFFDQIDADHNQQLSRAEIEAWAGKMREQFQAEVQQRFAAADANADGQLSREEAQAAAPRIYEHFEFLDANDDGAVTLAELQQLRDPTLMRQRVLERVRAADRNGDGKLDLAEVQASLPGMAAHFTLLDRDRDGYLTPDDFAGMGGF
jgi:Ca2+-binding EF-hand superfamily protein